MGRFASTVDYYTRYREPYPAVFFRAVATKLALTGKERLLDVACGPAPLAIGLAPFVASVTGVDPEPNMLDVARTAAREAGVKLELIAARLEALPENVGEFDLVTIGRAIHWFDRAAALPVLERLAAKGGPVVICGATTSSSAVNPWIQKFKEVRQAWSSEPPHALSELGAVPERWVEYFQTWFAGSRFRLVDDISVAECHRITIPELVGRALSMSSTAPAALGDRRVAFEQAMADALQPYSQNGVLEEEVKALAAVLR